jgi:hypothetical protein
MGLGALMTWVLQANSAVKSIKESNKGIFLIAATNIFFYGKPFFESSQI